MDRLGVASLCSFDSSPLPVGFAAPTAITTARNQDSMAFIFRPAHHLVRLCPTSARLHGTLHQRHLYLQVQHRHQSLGEGLLQARLVLVGLRGAFPWVTYLHAGWLAFEARSSSALKNLASLQVRQETRRCVVCIVFCWQSSTSRLGVFTFVEHIGVRPRPPTLGGTRLLLSEEA
jgi:hypothetical protein